MPEVTKLEDGEVGLVDELYFSFHGFMYLQGVSTPVEDSLCSGKRNVLSKSYQA